MGGTSARGQRGKGRGDGVPDGLTVISQSVLTDRSGRIDRVGLMEGVQAGAVIHVRARHQDPVSSSSLYLGLPIPGTHLTSPVAT